MKPKLLPLVQVLICYNFFQISAQEIDRNMFTTNGPVYATAQQGDTLFLGGYFDQIGYGVKKIARYLPNSTKPDFSFVQLTQDAILHAVEPDGNAGYYLCGRIYSYNGIVFNIPAAIIHILPDNSLDPAFEPTYLYTDYSYENSALCLKKVGNRLYLGGNFYSINGVNHKNIVALNANTGRLISWYPDEPDGTINKIEANESFVFLIGDFQKVGEHPVDKFVTLNASNGRYARYYSNYLDYNYFGGVITGLKIKNNKLYLGGDFNSLGYKSVGLARVSTATGEANINFPETNGLVNAIVSDGQGGYYIGGNFSLVNNIKRLYLAHILADGSVDNAFNFFLDGYISCLETDGVNLYFGGTFTRVNNTTRRHAAAVSLSEKKLTTWNPDPDDNVYTMTYSHGTIYMGGSFKNVRSQSRNYAAAVTPLNKLTAWNPQPDSYVRKIVASLSGNSLFIAGGFSVVKGEYHFSLAKVNNTDGEVSSWNPQLNGFVYDMVLQGSKLFIGGDFSSINGVQRQYLAAIDTAFTDPTDFSAEPNGPVSTLTIQDNKLYVGGSFSQLQNQSRKYCARIDLTTDSVDNWMPEPGYHVSAIAAGLTDIAIGGNFETINEINRNHLAAIDLITNRITEFNPSVNNFYVGSVNAFAFFGKELIVGGFLSYSDSNFSYYNGIISLDTVTGSITRYFDYLPDYNSSVRALTVSANQLYAGGSFSALFNSRGDISIARYNLVSYNLINNKLTRNIYNPNNEVFALYIDSLQRIIAAGSFDLTKFVYRGNLAAFSLTAGTAINWAPFVTGEVRALALKDTSLFIGGSFYGIGNKDYSELTYRSNLAALSTKTGKPTSWNADAEGSIISLALVNSTLYAGGYFNTIKGVARNHAAALATDGTGTVKEWAPEPNSTVWAILPAGRVIYLAGDFTEVKGTARNFLCSVNSFSGIPTAWNPNPDYIIRVLTANATTLYAGGEFSTISGQPRQSLAAFTIATNTLTSFNPELKSNSSYYNAPELNSLALYGKSLFIASDGFATLDSIKGVGRYIFGAADTATGTATSFNPIPNSTINHIKIIGNRLFVGGQHTSFKTSPSSSYFTVFNLEPIANTDIFTNSETAPALPEGINANSSNNLKAVLIPNPAKDWAVLSMQGIINNVGITITDISGKVLWQSLKLNKQQIQIPVQTFAKGMYFITVRDNRKTSVIKFLKE